MEFNLINNQESNNFACKGTLLSPHSIGEKMTIVGKDAEQLRLWKLLGGVQTGTISLEDSLYNNRVKDMFSMTL